MLYVLNLLINITYHLLYLLFILLLFLLEYMSINLEHLSFLFIFHSKKLLISKSLHSRRTIQALNEFLHVDFIHFTPFILIKAEFLFIVGCVVSKVDMEVHGVFCIVHTQNIR